MSEKLLVVQAVVPDYRVGFFECLQEIKDCSIKCGESYFSQSVRTSSDVTRLSSCKSAKNYYLFNSQILFQVWQGILRDLSSKSVAVVELNPRALTSWLFLFRSKFAQRGKVVVWGHLYNRSGVVPWIRKKMIGLADGVVFYTREQVMEAKKILSIDNKPCGCAPNAISYSSEIRVSNEAGTDFIYVGRLVEEKKPLLLVEGFRRARPNLNRDAKLHIVGDGPELKSLKAAIRKAGLERAIIMHGHVSKREILAELYSSCIASVSPGYVGLSITQSLSFGKPMIVADKENHSPEIEAMVPGLTGHYFVADDSQDLAARMIDFDRSRGEWLEKSASIAQFCQDNYTYESMAQGFMSVVDSLKTV